jgi:small subunit ribosomal protein S2
MTKETKVSQKAETKKSLNVNIPELLVFLKAGAHFGHKTSAWNPKMKKYIHEQRNGVHIIDIVKTQKLLKTALEAINATADSGNILIVGTKGQASALVEEIAKENGAFYVTKRWPGGLFTNFGTIKKSIQKLVKMEETLASGGKDLVKKEILLIAKDVARLNKVYEGIKFMDELPKAIIVIDSKVEKNAITEANTVNIPVIALMDTNCDPDVVDFPIPANDDSIKSINLFLDLFGEVLKSGKKPQALVALRKNYYATLASKKEQYVAEKEREERMAEDERLKMKALREGKFEKSSVGVVRVVKKEKNLDQDYEKAEAVKAKTNSKKIEDLGLPTRVEKALSEAGIKTVEGITGKSKEQLIEIKGVGEKAAEDILKAIK